MAALAASKSFFKLENSFLRPISMLYNPTRQKYRLVRKNEKLASTSMNWADTLFEEFEKDEKKSEPPSLLHLVTRVKPLKGRPYWEKDMMKRLKLDTPMHKKVVHKNTPSINAMLKTVKHLINIVPVTFPNGLPENESDYEHCLLLDNGKFIIRKKLDPLNTETVPSVAPAKNDLWKMDSETLDRHLILHLRHRRLNQEYFPAKYEYKYNQDGEEYRYKNPNVKNDADWY